MSDLAQKSCSPCKTDDHPLSTDAAAALLKQLPQWELRQDDQTITRVFRFKNYYQTMAFVNAVAWIAHQQDHHPDMYVSYNRCEVCYTTHAVTGLSENDFICAAKIDAILSVE
ncbi:4a-hydroxytetrahydrobiopterin dehydratase [Kaarinaea lacus]